MTDNAPYGGWVKLYRSFLDWEWYSDTNCVRLALHFLLKANYQPKQWQGFLIGRGQFMTSRARLVAETGLSEREVRTAWQRLTECGFSSSETSSKYSIVTICNYGKYQERDDTQRPAESPTNDQPTTSQRPTNVQPTSSQRPTTEEYKNIINKEDITHINSSFSVIDKPASAHDHAPVVAPASVTARNMSDLLAWIEARTPKIAAMAEPITRQQAGWMLRKYDVNDIHRILATMQSKQVYECGTNAFTHFDTYAQMDHIILQKQRDGGLLTYEQMCNLIPSKAKSTDFEPVEVNGARMWRRKNNQAK